MNGEIFSLDESIFEVAGEEIKGMENGVGIVKRVTQGLKHSPLRPAFCLRRQRRRNHPRHILTVIQYLLRLF